MNPLTREDKARIQKEQEDSAFKETMGFDRPELGPEWDDPAFGNDREAAFRAHKGSVKRVGANKRKKK